MVPNGWNRIQIGEVCSAIVDCVNKTAPVVEGPTPYRMIRTTNVRNNRVDTENVRFVTEETFRIWTRRGELTDGDIILTREAPVGEVGQLKNASGVFLGQRTMVYRADPSRMDQQFLFQAMISPGLKRQYEADSAGGTVAHIRVPDCSKFLINVPPIAEQKKIAEILSTWDRAIEVAEAQLDCARTQKRALMQHLLTGRRRFPEFEGQEWKEVRLGEVASVIVSNVDKKSKDGETPVRLCNYTDVYKREFIEPSQVFMSATASAAQIKKFGLRTGDVVITKDSETADDIAMPTYIAESAADLVCGYHLAIVRPCSKVDGQFLKYFFELPHTRYYFGTRANGAIRFGLTIDGIKGAKLRLPPYEEQERIASVLKSSEVEISALVDSITKLRTEKKALMQQLLTGKRRVSV
ncbi:restriction endonuclease subunit S [Shimia sp. R9_1]|uniref:restriction endonuclease subunit S n=1 Tax=Shimia sp. R9_1 TaxID=2821111 RepID=UPI001ADCF155|nr:restriction endonuclease subunit S [Shimia sp. R9_1]MBO9406177.1 restriction endonuclease subunit S [Shimia sp. R9_1]